MQRPWRHGRGGWPDECIALGCRAGWMVPRRGRQVENKSPPSEDAGSSVPWQDVAAPWVPSSSQGVAHKLDCCFTQKRSNWAVIRKLPGEGGLWMEEAWEQVLSWLAVRDVRKNSFVLNRCIVLGSHEIWFLFKFTIWDSTLCYVIWQDCCCQARRRVEKPTWILQWCPNGHDSMVCSWGPGDTHHLPWRSVAPRILGSHAL